MLLDTVDRSLVVVLGEVKTTDEMVFNAQIEDKIVERTTPQTFLAPSDGATPVELVAPPLANTVRRIVELNLSNIDTITHHVYVGIKDGSDTFVVKKATLTAGQTLTYNEFSGWTIG